MSSLVIALIFGIGVTAFIWSKLSQSTGNARPTHVLAGAAAAGLIAAIVLLTILKGLLGL